VPNCSPVPSSCPATACRWGFLCRLKESPFHDLARKYLPRGAGASSPLASEGGYEAGTRLVENVQLFSHLANIATPQPHSPPRLDDAPPAHRTSSARPPAPAPT